MSMSVRLREISTTSWRFNEIWGVNLAGTTRSDDFDLVATATRSYLPGSAGKKLQLSTWAGGVIDVGSKLNRLC